jgi:hypothetical protein
MPRRAVVVIFRTEASVSRAVERRQAKVVRLCREGRRHAARAEHAEALSCFLEAWELLPEPKEAWSASTFVLAGLGDLVRSGVDPFAARRRRRARSAHAAV